MPRQTFKPKRLFFEFRAFRGKFFKKQLKNKATRGKIYKAYNDKSCRYVRHIISEVFILRLALAIAQIVLSVVLVAVVLLQQSRRQGLSGAISGAADTFFSKNKSGNLDSVLVKVTAVVAAIFIIVTLVLNFFVA